MNFILQIHPKETILLFETGTAYINLTLTIPIIPCSKTPNCPMFVFSYTPDLLQDDCRVTSLVEPNDHVEPCGTAFTSHDQIPVLKRIALKAKASDTNNFLSREFGVFLMTSIPKHDLMHNQLLGVVRVSILVILFIVFRLKNNIKREGRQALECFLILKKKRDLMISYD